MGIRGRVLAALVVGAALLTVCTSAASAAPAAGQLTVYNGQHVQTTQALVTAFEKMTGISVHVRNDSEDVLTDQIVAEGARSPDDVVFTENSPPLQHLQSLGLLAKVDPSTLKNTPNRFNSPSGNWVGVSARVSVIVYNTRLLKPSQLPTSVLQLAKPRWSGKLAIAPSETDFQPIVTSVARTYGSGAAVKWLEGLKANAGAAHTYPDSETVTDDVNRGLAAIGIINQYYWYRLRAQVGTAATHSAIAYLAPHDPGYVIDVSGAGILRSSTHKAAAQRFLAFLTSPAGQRIIARSDSFEYPVASGVTTAQPETPFAQLQPNSISVADLGDGHTAIALLIQVQLI